MALFGTSYNPCSFIICLAVLAKWYKTVYNAYMRNIYGFGIQCPLGFATLGKAAALGLATSRALTDLRQYINSDLGFSNLEI